MGKFKIEVRLREILDEKGWEQKRLAEETGLTERTVSELINGKMKRFPKEALERIADVLEINDINKIITFVIED